MTETTTTDNEITQGQCDAYAAGYVQGMKDARLLYEQWWDELDLKSMRPSSNVNAVLERLEQPKLKRTREDPMWEWKNVLEVEAWINGGPPRPNVLERQAAVNGGTTR